MILINKNQTPKADFWRLNSVKGESVLAISLLKRLSSFCENFEEWNLDEWDENLEETNKEIK